MTFDGSGCFVNYTAVWSQNTTTAMKLRLILKVLRPSSVHSTSLTCCLLPAQGQRIRRHKCTERSTKTLALAIQSPFRCVTSIWTSLSRMLVLCLLFFIKQLNLFLIYCSLLFLSCFLTRRSNYHLLSCWFNNKIRGRLCVLSYLLFVMHQVSVLRL